MAYVRALSAHVMLPAALLMCSASARAQVAPTAASLTGRVSDASGAAIPRAAIGITNTETGQQRATVTNSEGRYRVLSILPGQYHVTVTCPGFAPVTRLVTLGLGESADVPFTLSVASLAENVTVTRDAAVVDLARSQAAEAVTPQEVQTLPLNGRNYLDLALLTTGVSRTNTGAAQRFAETSAVPGTGISVSSQRNLNNNFVVDGLSANDDAAGLSGAFFSQEVIREFQVVTGGGVAEFGRASSGVMNIVTQSGTARWRGSGYSFFRDDALDARNPLLQSEDPLSQQQFGGSIGGPLRRDRLFMFSNAEWTANDRTGAITILDQNVAAVNARLTATGYRAPLLATGAFPTGYDTANLFGRVDHQSAGGARATVRYSLYDVRSANARSVGGLNAESRGTALDNRDQTVALSFVATPSQAVLYEVRAQATRSRLSAPPNDLIGPPVNISGVASFGTSTTSPTGRDTDLYEVAGAVSMYRGSHVLKAGADVLYNRVDILFPGAIQGVYSFSSLPTFEAGLYTQFQQAFGVPNQFQSNPNLGVFVQDEWRATGALTFNVGLRYDVQWLPDPIETDWDNVSPRAGVAWSPGDRRTVVRASGGLYYDRIPLRATSNALQRDGEKYKVAVLAFSQPGTPVFPSVLQRFPDGLLTSITTIDPSIDASLGRQFTVQVERTFWRDATATVSYQHLTGRGLIMSRNVNAPTLSAAEAAAKGIPNLGRPDPRYANVSRFESIGQSDYNGLSVALRANHSSWFIGRLAYTFSRAYDDSGNFFFSQPQDANDVHADWGPSDNDQAHRLTFSGNALSTSANPWLTGWQFAWIFSYTSALPFNPVTGTDRNNDTNLNDRPVGMGRNSFRGFDATTVDVRLSRALTVKHWKLELIAEAFNVLNHTNFQLPNNTYGPGVEPRPTFGTPQAAGDPRQIQFGVRVTY
jgi:hypothetical protein